MQASVTDLEWVRLAKQIEVHPGGRAILEVVAGMAQRPESLAMWVQPSGVVCLASVPRELLA